VLDDLLSHPMLMAPERLFQILSDLKHEMGGAGHSKCPLHRHPIQALGISIFQQTAVGVKSETDNDRFSLLLQL